jgi:hypothetical protein
VRREEIVSRRFEDDDPRDGVLAFRACMDLKNLISRIELAASNRRRSRSSAWA